MKKKIRRSTIFAKRTNYDIDNSVIIIDDTIEGESSVLMIHNIKNDEVISLSSESSEYISDSLSECSVSKKSNPVISSEADKKEKTIKSVNKWLSDNEKTVGYANYFSFQRSDINNDDNLNIDKLQVKLDEINISNNENLFDKTSTKLFDSTIKENLTLNNVQVHNEVGVKKNDIFTPVKITGKNER